MQRKIFEVSGFLREPGAVERAKLRIRKQVLLEAQELLDLQRAVENLERAKEYIAKPVRLPISDDVRVAVWARDGGKCVLCSSTEKLHFDHIIPVAKGGSNLVENIQILCQTCNLKKSDRIA